MKPQLVIPILLGLGLFTTSCLTVRTYRTITLMDLYPKVPPFEATFEGADISHPLLAYTTADILLRRVDNGKGIDVIFYPSNTNVIDFVHSLQKGERYWFPQVFEDYKNSHQTNAVKTPPNTSLEPTSTAH